MLLSFAFAATMSVIAASPVIDHDLDVSVDTAKKRIDVVDKMTLDVERSVVELMLHAGLSPSVEGADKVDVTAVPPGGAVKTEMVRATFAKPTKKLTVKYGGVIDHAPQQVATEHQRSFQETPGTIAAQGVYLSASSLWVPRVVEGGPGRRLDELVTVKMRVKGLPAGWKALSEGDPAGDNAWISTTPSDDVHLVAGPFVEVKERKRGVDVRIWLRADDKGQMPADGAGLAQRYIEVTGQYLGLYNDLIGPYPYGKFALVENFWETGYGMPSFTLLGPQVVRFPFILHTSWPHELLHNWWGNGVFVKPDTGNWSEGLTAYLADHLHAEHEGKGDEYRRTTLQKYQDFVSVDASLDFPLETFGARFSSASEAVGYGKWLMVVHMVRRKLGDDAFARALKRFWREHRFERATFDDFREAIRAEAGADASWVAPFFDAWVKRAGAPTIAWRDVRAQGREGSRRVDVVLEQTQKGDAFPMDVPVYVTLSDGRVVSSVVPFTSSKSARVSIPVPAKAARVDIDPFADTFRALLPGETAPSLSRALGAKKALFVLPTLALPEERTAWTAFANAMCATCRVVDDKDLDQLPVDASIWVLGYGNQLRGGAAAGVVRYQARFDDIGFLPPGKWTRERLKAERTNPGQTSLVLALPSPRHPSHALVFVGAHKREAIPLLARKIPHYGKYGYLGFSGDAAENSLKGQWTPDSAPLSVFLDPRGERPQLAAKQAPALAKLPPPFDADRMLADVKALAAMNGRGNGTRDLDEAFAYVLARLPNAKKSCSSEDAKVCNVVATIAGSDKGLAPVVIGAHVDHLGKVRGKVHPGADDNASGVAVLLEVARALSKQGPFARDVLLVAFGGEEDGLKGSRAFVKSLGADAKTKVHSMVNLDVVGRRPSTPGAKFLVLDGASASEWVHIVRGVGFTTGVAAELAKEGGGASDQQAFLEAGIPAMQLFSGPNADYHKPTDTADKVDGASLVDAAVMTREIAAYLADRKEPLSASGTSGGGATGGRRVSLGTVPDMTFTGPGVKVDDVVAGSPAASAGITKGDVLVKFDGAAVNDLRGYSDLLKTKKPGDKVKVVVRRGEKDVELEAVLVER